MFSLPYNNPSQMYFPLPNYLVIILLIISFVNLPSTNAVDPYLGWKCVANAGNYTLNSPYQSNLLTSLANLTTLSSSDSFANFTAGDSKDKVYALYDCRDDLPQQTCHDCVVNATATITQICPLNKEALITYEECMLRYANRPIFSTVDLKYPLAYCKLSVPDDGGELNRTVTTLIGKLIDEATSGTPTRYFALGSMSYSVHQDIYCMVQCTPDLTRADCKDCLMDAYNSTIAVCANSTSLVGRHSGPSCQIRYSWFRFFNSTSGPGLGLGPSPSTSPSIVASPVSQRPGLGKTNGSYGLQDLIISNAMLLTMSLFLFLLFI